MIITVGKKHQKCDLIEYNVLYYPTEFAKQWQKYSEQHHTSDIERFLNYLCKQGLAFLKEKTSKNTPFFRSL